MRMRWMVLVALASLSGGIACGSDAGDGPPGTGGNNVNTGEPEPDPEEPIDPIPGTCQRLCCSSADCGDGETCTALDSANGTLGVCSGSGVPIGDPPVTLPEGCWSANEPQCNPLTNEGCAAGDACDYGPGDAEYEPVLGCFGGDNTQGPSETCDLALGPWCVPGYTCVPNG